MIKERIRKWLGIQTTEPIKEEAAKLGVSKEVLAIFQANGNNQNLAQWGSKVVMARPVTRYEPAPGVVPAAPQLAMDKANDPLGLAYDDGGNFAPNYTWLNQNYCGLGFPGYAYLSELAQRSEYRSPSETMAKEMTRKFIKLNTSSKGDKSEKIKEIELWFKKHDVRQVCLNALTLDLFFGRSQIFIDIRGQEDDIERAKPLVIDSKTIRKGTVAGFKVIEPIWTSPYTYNATDPTKPDFYVPYAWYVLGRKIHNSRLMTVISRPVPDLLKPAYNFGGISLTQLMEPYVIRWLRTVDGVNRIINNFSIIALATNMAAILQGKAGEAQGLLDRAKLFSAARDNQGLMLVDKNTEELTQIAVPLSSLDHLQAQAQEHMAAPSHIPLIKLTGITPSGLNASSEGEITVWHEFVHSEQENVLEPILDKILDLAQLDLYGEIDDDIDYTFVPLIEATQKEIADIRKSDGDLAAALIDRGVVSPDEVREKLANDPESGYSNLSGPAPEPVEPDGEFDIGEESLEE